jgi:hypothetical protein
VAPAITVHFHPGWGFGDATVIDALASGGVYRTQWETGTSNGGLTAHRDGDRWRWESRMFAGRYDSAAAADRPVYGAWNRHDDPYGASPRFGSAYLRLRPEVLTRTTFCWPDSVYEPEAFGEQARLAELCAMADAGVLDDPLNDYVEAHLHGGLAIARDVDALVVDPSDREEHAEALDHIGCNVEVHPGYRVRADDIDPAYRGEVPVDLARSLGGDLTPARLAAAARSGDHDPQALKWLWHCLAQFGRRQGRR